MSSWTVECKMCGWHWLQSAGEMMGDPLMMIWCPKCGCPPPPYVWLVIGERIVDRYIKAEFLRTSVVFKRFAELVRNESDVIDRKDCGWVGITFLISQCRSWADWLGIRMKVGVVRKSQVADFFEQFAEVLDTRMVQGNIWEPHPRYPKQVGRINDVCVALSRLTGAAGDYARKLGIQFFEEEEEGEVGNED